MKYLLPPGFAVLFSTLGVAFGCNAVGMPLQEVKLATAVAFLSSFTVAFGALLLAGRRRPGRRQSS